MPSVTLSLAVLAGIALASAAAAAPTLARSCVLDASGNPVCTRLDDGRALGMGFAPLVRPIACDENDVTCFCLRAVQITNEIRSRRGGNGDLVPGTQSMLDNAVEHSKEMAGPMGMEHQDLATASKKVGCDVFINRENIAMFGGMDKDPAVQCMEQWEGSPGHLENIVGAEAGEYVTIGIYKDGDSWWCTQTFGIPGNGDCPMVTGSSGGGSPATVPAPTMAVTIGAAPTQAASSEPTSTVAAFTLPVASTTMKKMPEKPTKPADAKPEETTSAAEESPEMLDGKEPVQTLENTDDLSWKEPTNWEEFWAWFKAWKDKNMSGNGTTAESGGSAGKLEVSPMPTAEETTEGDAMQTPEAPTGEPEGGIPGGKYKSRYGF
jgi:hypothetical protein